MRMTQEEFEREWRCQVIMHFARKMLTEGLVSEEEYCQIDTKILQRLRPKTGGLLNGKSLLCPPGYGNMAPEKEA